MDLTLCAGLPYKRVWSGYTVSPFVTPLPPSEKPVPLGESPVAGLESSGVWQGPGHAWVGWSGEQLAAREGRKAARATLGRSPSCDVRDRGLSFCHRGDSEGNWGAVRASAPLPDPQGTRARAGETDQSPSGWAPRAHGSSPRARRSHFTRSGVTSPLALLCACAAPPRRRRCQGDGASLSARRTPGPGRMRSLGASRAPPRPARGETVAWR